MGGGGNREIEAFSAGSFVAPSKPSDIRLHQCAIRMSFMTEARNDTPCFLA